MIEHIECCAGDLICPKCGRRMCKNCVTTVATLSGRREHLGKCLICSEAYFEHEIHLWPRPEETICVIGDVNINQGDLQSLSLREQWYNQFVGTNNAWQTSFIGDEEEGAEMDKFKSGDRVICIDAPPDSVRLRQGEIYIVDEVRRPVGNDKTEYVYFKYPPGGWWKERFRLATVEEIKCVFPKYIKFRRMIRLQNEES